ncbi:hypothetical protein ACLKMY_37130 [Paraburkholderia mimosarum]|uniref:hypothetical protein n=1 Tax=Paraburkholderia mimosarum TaxID=312026 RepID=UPI0039C1EA3C
MQRHPRPGWAGAAQPSNLTINCSLRNLGKYFNQGLDLQNNLSKNGLSQVFLCDPRNGKSADSKFRGYTLKVLPASAGVEESVQ